MTRREQIKAMTIEEYARYVGLDCKRAKDMRDNLQKLEMEGRIVQNGDGTWDHVENLNRSSSQT